MEAGDDHGCGIGLAWPSLQHLAAMTALGEKMTQRSSAIASPEVPSRRVFLGGADDAIVVDRVWFRHASRDRWILRDVSLRVRRGEVRILRRVSGAGKTTLLRLLAGLYEPEGGTVVIDGRAAAADVCYLPQGAELLPLSLLENLRVFSGGASDARIREAAGETGLDAIISEWPLGYESLLSRGNATISSGQRQLVLLTAAVASNRCIVLLDETLSHVDQRLRGALSLSALFAGRTVVSVEHADHDDRHDEDTQGGQACADCSPV